MARPVRIVVEALDRASAVLNGITGNVKSAGAAFKTLAGSVGGIVGLGSVAAGLHQIVVGLDRLNDLRDATGASIENLSALEDIVARTGGTMEQVSAVLLRFNQALDDATPGSEIEQALAAIGLSARELRALDPAEGMMRFALALRQSGVDAQEAARIMRAVYARAVADAAPILNDMADSGQLVATVTADQVKQSERLLHAWAGLRKDATDLGRVLVGVLLPQLARLVAEARVAIEVFGGLRAAMEGMRGMGFGGLEGNLERVNRQLAEREAFQRRLQEQGTALGARQAQQMEPYIQGLRRQLEVLQRIEAVRAGPRAQEEPAVDLRAAARVAALDQARQRLSRNARTDAAEQRERVRALAQAERERAEVLARLDALTGRGATRQLAEDTALLHEAMITGRITLDEYRVGMEGVNEARRRLSGEAAADAARQRERNEEMARLADLTGRGAWEQWIRDAELVARAQRDGAIGAEDLRIATEALNEAWGRLSGATARAAEGQRLYNDEQARLDALTGRGALRELARDTDLVRRAMGAGTLTAEEYRAATEALADTKRRLSGETSRTQDAAERLSLTLTSSIGRLIETGGSASDFFRALSQDVAKLIMQITVLEPLTRQIRAAFAGGSGGGGGWLDTIGGWLGSLWGGQRAAGGPVSRGRAYLVGERGPELFMPRAGGDIVPSHKLGRGDTYNIDARGADPAGLARLETLILQLHGSIEHRAVAAVLDARHRGGTFAGAFA